MIALIILGIISIGLCIGVIIYYNRKNAQLRAAAEQQVPIPVEQFLKNKSALMLENCPGIYIIHNLTKNMYYVGQSIHVIQRSIQHFTGHGNGDVYADYKYGDNFTITIILLKHTNYTTLNALERDYIRAYHCYGNGYNHTRGNKG